MTSGASPPKAPGALPVGTRRVAYELAWSLLLATALGAAFSIYTVLASRSVFGRPLPWMPTMVSVLQQTWLWALLAPGILSVSRRFPLLAPRRSRHLAIHLGAGIAFAALYAAVSSVAHGGLGADAFRPRFSLGDDRHPPRSMGVDSLDRSRPLRPDPGPPGPSRFETPPLDERRPTGPRPPEFWRRFEPPPWTARVGFDFATRLPLHLAVYAAIAAAWHWIDHQRRFRLRERQAQELSRQLTEARLQALRMQLNPHFLFNTLNAIATLVHRDPRAADEMIACLSDFLRLTLAADASPENTLRAELEFARRYLDIEKVRFGERLTVAENLAPDTLDLAVPTLVLQPLIENAIRHGIERCEHPGTIRLEAHTAPNRELRLVVADTGPGLATEGTGPRQGVGLANTRARLRELYGDRASLDLTACPGGGVRVEVRLPARPLAGAPSPNPEVPS